MGSPYRPFESRETVLGYQRGAEFRSKLLGAATQRMLEQARLKPGHKVLDVGTGPAATAVLAARMVQPEGRVLAIDASPEMVGQAEATVRQAGLDNVEIRLMDGAALDLADTGMDAVISRNAMQFLPDWPAPLEGFHRVLRPGGRLSFMVWDIREFNPFFLLPATVARDLGLLRVPMDALRLAFGLSNAPLAEQLTAAGFREVVVEQIRGEVHLADAAPALAYTCEGPNHHLISGELNDREKGDYDAAIAAALEGFREGNGYRIESVTRVASGTR